MTFSGQDRSGFYFSSVAVILGSLFMSLIDVHRKNLRKQKRKTLQRSQSRKSYGNSSIAPNAVPSTGPQDGPEAGSVGINMEADLSSPSSQKLGDIERKLSFTDQDDVMPPVALLSHQRSFTYDDLIDIKNKPELTMFSEEGIADMDLPDHLFIEELEYLDNITSCNKVENCVMLSEYEQNLIKETESPPVGGGSYGRRARKWSLFRQPSNLHSEGSPELSMTIGVGGVRQSSFHGDHMPSSLPPRRRTSGNNTSGAGAANATREIPVFPNTAAWNSRLQMPNSTGQKRSITVIEEASV